MQLLANNASALLSGAISAVATTLSVEPARADLFPIGNTTNFAAPLDWFKATLEDVSGNVEIIYVGVRAAASGVMSTVLRGQEGTVARAFAAGSVVELRFTAADAQAAVAATSNIPSGGISATTVQGAINELDAEKAPISLRDGKGFTNPVTLASAATTDIGAQNSFAVEISGAIGITSFGANYNGPRFLRFTGAAPITHNATTLNLPGAANITTAAGDTCIAYPNLALSGWNVVSYTRASGAPLFSTFLSGQLFGCTMSTAGASATMSIAAGTATDSTNAVSMALTAIAKTTAAWAVGTAAGGLDTGAIANSTWYHYYVIRRPDTSVVDVVFSLSATSPTLPTNYTQFRRIGSGRTNGSAQWTAFIQDGDEFQWLAPVVDISVTNPGIAAASRSLTVPSGVRVAANIQLVTQNLASGGNVYAYISDLATNDAAPTATFSDVPDTQNFAGSARYAGSRLRIRSNTSQQIRSRLSFSDASVAIYITTLGWTDSRGRDA